MPPVAFTPTKDVARNLKAFCRATGLELNQALNEILGPALADIFSHGNSDILLDYMKNALDYDDQKEALAAIKGYEAFCQKRSFALFKYGSGFLRPRPPG